MPAGNAYPSGHLVLDFASFAPIIANLFLYGYKGDFMSNLHKSKTLDIVDKFNDTSLYLDDKLTIDNPELKTYLR